MAFVTVLNVNGLSLSRSGDYKHPALQASNGSFSHSEMFNVITSKVA